MSRHRFRAPPLATLELLLTPIALNVTLSQHSEELGMLLAHPAELAVPGEFGAAMGAASTGVVVLGRADGRALTGLPQRVHLQSGVQRVAEFAGHELDHPAQIALAG